jgi:hypothetical protein
MNYVEFQFPSGHIWLVPAKECTTEFRSALHKIIHANGDGDVVELTENEVLEFDRIRYLVGRIELK